MDRVRGWIGGGWIANWFKWLEWVMLASALLLAVEHCTSAWTAGLVLALAVVSFACCQLALLVWWVEPILAAAARWSCGKAGRTLVVASAAIASLAVVISAIAALHGLLNAAFMHTGAQGCIPVD